MKEELQIINEKLNKIKINEDEVTAFGSTIDELKNWLLYYSEDEQIWQWSTKAIFENLNFYLDEIDFYRAQTDEEIKKHKFPLLKASIAMEIAEIQRYLAS